ncbi:MAG: hypothetical protein ACPKQO_04785 [Nitrososphaeraceae archaeon]
MKEDETKQYVIECMIKRLPEQEALKYLKDKDCEMSHATYWRKRKNILKNRFKRIKEILDHELIDQHLERIDELRLIKKEMWSRYENEQDNAKAFNMLIDYSLLSIRGSLLFYSQLFYTHRYIYYKVYIIKR